MITLYGIAQFASGFFGLLAAVLWFKSAMVTTPEKFSVHVVEASGLLGQPLGTKYVGYGYSSELSELAQALIRQSRWNAWGARSAAVAAFLQVFITLILPT
jgi:hypothetical protein